MNDDAALDTTTSLSVEIERVLDQQVRPLIRGHVGDVSVDSVHDDGTVVVRFTGACVGCPNQATTMEALVGPVIETIEGVVGVERSGNVRISEHARRRIRELLGPLPG